MTPSRPTVTARERLLAAGEPLLQQLQGRRTTEVSSREIARRAGVTWATFFHHFKDLHEYTAELAAHVGVPVEPGEQRRSLWRRSRAAMPVEDDRATA